MYKKCEEILKELESSGKIKVWWDFKFPEKQELKTKLKDLLEDSVDEKYYLTERAIRGGVGNSLQPKQNRKENNERKRSSSYNLC